MAGGGYKPKLVGMPIADVNACRTPSLILPGNIKREFLVQRKTTSCQSLRNK